MYSHTTSGPYSTRSRSCRVGVSPYGLIESSSSCGLPGGTSTRSYTTPLAASTRRTRCDCTSSGAVKSVNTVRVWAVWIMRGSPGAQETVRRCGTTVPDAGITARAMHRRSMHVLPVFLLEHEREQGEKYQINHHPRAHAAAHELVRRGNVGQERGEVPHRPVVLGGSHASRVG